jgi:Arc/MetJ-type ribon-helix-helix transcriptional regulator
MILCLEIDQETKAKLDQLVREGEYRDYSQAVAVAVSNQLLLHGRIESGGAVVVENAKAPRRDVRAHTDSIKTVPSVFGQKLMVI